MELAWEEPSSRAFLERLGRGARVVLFDKRTRRKLSSLRRSSGNLLETDVDAFGRRALYYDGIPILVDDFIPTDEEQGTSGAVCSSIYAVKFGMRSDGARLERPATCQSLVRPGRTDVIASA